MERPGLRGGSVQSRPAGPEGQGLTGGESNQMPTSGWYSGYVVATNSLMTGSSNSMPISEGVWLMGNTAALHTDGTALQAEETPMGIRFSNNHGVGIGFWEGTFKVGPNIAMLLGNNQVIAWYNTDWSWSGIRCSNGTFQKTSDSGSNWSTL